MRVMCVLTLSLFSRLPHNHPDTPRSLRVQVLHDAFFKYATKPSLTIHGDLYYEGKEFEVKAKNYKPGKLSEEAKQALGIPPGLPPPLPSLRRGDSSTGVSGAAADRDGTGGQDSGGGGVVPVPDADASSSAPPALLSSRAWLRRPPWRGAGCGLLSPPSPLKPGCCLLSGVALALSIYDVPRTQSRAAVEGLGTTRSQQQGVITLKTPRSGGWGGMRGTLITLTRGRDDESSPLSF